MTIRSLGNMTLSFRVSRSTQITGMNHPIQGKSREFII